jgi:hypothetical protein
MGYIPLGRRNRRRPLPSQCEICERQVKLGWDHCHAHGTVRGALCNACNLRVGGIDAAANRPGKGRIRWRRLDSVVPYLDWRRRCPDCPPIDVSRVTFKSPTGHTKEALDGILPVS